MSQKTEGNSKTFKSGEDLTDDRYKIAKLDGTGRAVLASSATDELIGILDDGPENADESVPVLLRSGAGTYKVMVAEAISIGAKVTSDSAAKGVTTTTDKDQVIGVALEASTADGDIIEVLICNYTLSI